MNSDKAPLPGSFEAEFQARVNGIYERGKKVGLSVNAICSKAGVARATPPRWRRHLPMTIALVDKMEAVVAEAEKHVSDDAC